MEKLFLELVLFPGRLDPAWAFFGTARARNCPVRPRPEKARSDLDPGRS
jgi:hypothetical protein